MPADPAPAPSSTPPARPTGTPGWLVVLLLLSLFGYGVFQYYQTTSVPQGFRMTPVEANLRAIFLAAQDALIKEGVYTIDYATLTAPEGRLAPVESVYGEDYHPITLDRETLEIGVQLPDNGPFITFEVTPRELIELRERAKRTSGE